MCQRPVFVQATEGCSRSRQGRRNECQWQVAPRSTKPTSTKRAMSIWRSWAGSIFARRLIDTVLRNNLWQFKKVRNLESVEPSIEWRRTGKRLHAFQSWLFVIVVIVTLDVHDTLASFLKRSATPYTDSFVYCLVIVSVCTRMLIAFHVPLGMCQRQ